MPNFLNKRTLTALQIILAVILKCSGDRKYIVPHYSSDITNASASSWEEYSGSRPVVNSRADRKPFFSSRYSKVETDNSANLTSAIMPQSSDSTSLGGYYNPTNDNLNHFTDWQELEGATSLLDAPIVPDLSQSPTPMYSTDYKNYNNRLDGTYNIPNGYPTNFYVGNAQGPYRSDGNVEPVTYDYKDYLTDLAEVENKLFAKTVIATKLLKLGKFVFVFFMVIVVIIIAGIGKTGVALSPLVLPLALIPLGIVALLLFIPLFLLFLPFVAKEMDGGGRERGFKMGNPTFDNLIELIVALEDSLST